MRWVDLINEATSLSVQDLNWAVNRIFGRYLIHKVVISQK